MKANLGDGMPVASSSRLPRAERVKPAVVEEVDALAAAEQGEAVVVVESSGAGPAALLEPGSPKLVLKDVAVTEDDVSQDAEQSQLPSPSTAALPPLRPPPVSEDASPSRSTAATSSAASPMLAYAAPLPPYARPQSLRASLQVRAQSRGTWRGKGPLGTSYRVKATGNVGFDVANGGKANRALVSGLRRACIARAALLQDYLLAFAAAATSSTCFSRAALILYFLPLCRAPPSRLTLC